MPLRGEGHSDLVKDEAPYFKSLAEIDAWFAQPHDKWSGVLPYRSRPRADGQPKGAGKLLVCHDYKGGYTESASELCYTFNFWQLCDTFIYFSHQRFAAPPSGWINAAHKQGVRMLGTLILEHTDADSDTLQLLVGRPNVKITDGFIPISKRYAVLLAELAHQRGFDGYLLNVEIVLRHKANQARALAAWMLLLRAELRARVGPHAVVMWYDSVLYDGALWWQNRLNGYNLPFFLASDMFFTNYAWLPQTQDSMTQYFIRLKDLNFAPTHTMQSIHTGVDVWPDRNQYGNGGWSTYRALTHTSPRGFSAAIFAPGWTWESVTEHPEQNWDAWWENERMLWLGPLRSEEISSPNVPEGPFQPITKFFPDLPPPDPSEFVFYSHFSPGVGYSWFVEGNKVLNTTKGWTDIDKQTSIGNLVWPRPTPSLQSAQEVKATFIATTALDMTDGYNGGNTLKLTLTYAPNQSGDVIWLPVQSLAIATQVSFEARVIYKTVADDNADITSHIFVKSHSGGENTSSEITLGQATVSDLKKGWTQQVINFVHHSTRPTECVAIGFFVSIRPKGPSSDFTFSISLGQLAVYPSPPPRSVSVGTPSVAAAKFVPANDAFEGVLTWDTTSTLVPIDVEVNDPESTTPAWLLDDTPAYRFPTFVYFNIYAAALESSDAKPESANATFIGTTGLDGRTNRFYVDKACLPTDWNAPAGVRFYIQGVTDRGEVLPWDRSAAVDYLRSAA